MQTTQTKSHSPDTVATKTAEAPQNTAIKATSATHVPAWASRMGELPAGLVSQDTHIIPGFQAKLTINQPNDPYEQEADRVAEQVMKKPATEAPLRQDSLSLMRKEGNRARLTSDAPPIISEALSTGGQPLGAETQTSMESRFGQDFSQVRVHTGAKAAESAQAVNAMAYTVGSDVVFGAGQFSPHTSKGTQLIVHELVHYLQQNGGQVSTANLVQRAPGNEGEGSVQSPYKEEQEVIRYAVGAHELGKLVKGAVLYNAKDWKAVAISDSAFYVGPLLSDMGNFYYVYRFIVSDPETDTYTLSRGSYLPGSDTKDLQDSLAKVQGGETLKLKITGLIPPPGGAVAEGAKKEGEEKKTSEESEGVAEPEVLTPQRKKWLTTGRNNMKLRITALFTEIQKVKASRIHTWEKNANIKDPKPIKEALEIAVEIVGYGMGG